MGDKDIDNSPRYKAGAEGSIVDGENGLTLEEYLRQDSPQTKLAQTDESLLSLARRLNNPPNPNLPAAYVAKAHQQDDQGEWREDFQLHLAASELRKGLFKSALPYIAVAVLVCAISGSAFFYLLTNYASVEGYRVATTPPNGAAPALEYTAGPAEPKSAAQASISDAKTIERLSPNPLSAFIAAANPRLGPAEEEAIEADRNPGGLAQGSTWELAEPAQQALPAGHTTEASTPPAVTSSAGTERAEADAAPPRKAAARTAALTPPPGTSLLDSGIPGAGYTPDAKPAATDKSGAAAAAPDIQLGNVTREQEDKMLARALDLMNQNDIAGARLLYQYLANRGSSAGALALAESYDARKLARYRITGMTPDAGLADVWYRRAAALGSKEAAAILRAEKR